MEPGELPKQRTEEMQRGRNSSAGERIFVTLVTKDRQPWLAVPRTRDVFLAVLRAWHSERNGNILAAVAMPDHAHLLIELGNLLTVDQLVARWKSTTRRGAGYADTFEHDFSGHRLRESENPEDYGLYMFLHPYRARLLKPDESWPGWWLPDAAKFKFPAMLNGAGGPPQEWVEWPVERFSTLTHGE